MKTRATLLIYSLLFILFLVCLAGPLAADQHQRVLILNSYHSSMTWVGDVQRGVREVLQHREQGTEIFSEYMDTKRVPFTPGYESQIATFLQSKYAQRRIDVILASDNNAFNFMRHHGDRLFPGVPVVFCGVNFFKDEQLDGHPNFTGVPEHFDARGTLELALRLHPDTRQVFVVNDYLPTGRAWNRGIRTQLEEMGLELPVRYAEKLPMTELQKQLALLPADSLVILGNYYRDGDDVFYPPSESTRMISSATDAPVYGMLDFRVGHGIVGGHVISGYYQGKTAARLMQEILDGKPVAEVPVFKAGANRLIFDSLQLHRFGIEASALPLGSLQVNQEKTLFTRQERQWMKAHPVIRVAPDPDFPPIEYFDESGAYHGLAADYVRLLEEKVGINFEIVRLDNWDQAVAQAQSREVDMWAAASPTEQRLEYMAFTQPMIEVPAVIMTRRDEQGLLGMQDLAGKRVTVVSGYAAHDYILNSYPDIQLEVAPDIRSALRKVSFGEVDAMVGNLATSTHYMEQEGISNLKVSGESGYFYRLSLAIRKDWPELHQILDKGLTMISDAERQVILDKWVRFEIAKRAWWQLSREQLMILLGMLVVLATASILAWNLILRKRVKERTSDLARINEQLNETNCQLSESEEKYRLIFESSEEPMWVIEGNHFTMTNEAAARLLGYHDTEELINVPPWKLSPETQPDGQSSQEKAKLMIGRAMEFGYHRFEWSHQKRDGTVFPVEVSLTRIPYKGQVAIFCVWNDITERKEAERAIQRLATHDALTGLASLRLAKDRINTAIAMARRNDERMAVLFIDLDGFKTVNDTHGHEAGDLVLKEVAARLKTIMREVDTVARIGGDEFLITLNRIEHAIDTERVSRKVIDSLRQPYRFREHQLTVGASLGIAIFPDHGNSQEELVKRADSAMYEVKKTGKNNYRIASTAAQ
ncbi:MAG: ABC transporter substrate binding protein [Candidatus Sedimenticola sp. 1PA]